MAARTSKDERFDPSYRSLPVYWPVRWRLVWSARSDRRAGLPIGLNADTTTVLRDLVARRDDACEHERTRYYADIRAIDVRLAEIDSQLTALQRDLAVRTEQAIRAAVRPTEQELNRRKQGEGDVPAELVRQRRATEHRRTVEAAKSEQLEAQLRLDATLAEEAQLEVRRQNRADVARSRVLRLVEYADRLAAVYRRALIRRHPQREALVTSWISTLAAPPAWVLTDDLTPSR
ncbi:hypothetical protein [Blastococcus saxobsidens]|uniref:Uncharacterized protein n=1 Tax=Blastococcus saxobsidens (strain DD2) TaxID=1146883 RepID=H6RT26_BLASD|nr:hypothetical protein [Blastococcus saxobsidens]CCG04329.1 protein of unknown function [Blastococcus saxobsidens DD2]